MFILRYVGECYELSMMVVSSKVEQEERKEDEVCVCRECVLACTLRNLGGEGVHMGES